MLTAKGAGDAATAGSSELVDSPPAMPARSVPPLTASCARAAEAIVGPAGTIVEMIGHRGLPLLNSLLAFLLWIGLSEGQPGDNRYGPNPKGL